MIPVLLRGGAIVIAVVAVIDPAVTSTRRTRPVVAVVAADPRSDDDAAGRIARELGRAFTVVRAPFGGAAGAVIVGRTLPPALAGFRGPAFAATPDAGEPEVAITGLSAPRVAGLDSRAPVTVTVRVSAAHGRTLDVALRAGGLVVDQRSRVVEGNEQTVIVPLTYVAAADGIARLEVVATLGEGGSSAAADAVIEVRETRWAALFVDGRPSWMSTFVRRAVERDPRVVVTSRVVTSRGVSTESGRPPSTLSDLAALEAFDVIVVGAPELLSDREAAGLEAFLRRRGGSVVLLLDQAERQGAAFSRLTPGSAWRSAHTTSATRIGTADEDAGWLRGARLVWPVGLPAVGEPLAIDSVGSRPVVWRAPVGAGTLVVSGAIDAWHARDPAASGFEVFWQALVADAAAAATPRIDVDVSSVLVKPAEYIVVTATLRDAALAATPGAAPASAPAGTLAGRSFRLWPGRGPGEYRAELRAPAEPGAHRLTVASGGVEHHTTIVVDTAVARPAPDDRASLALWVRSRGGEAMPTGETRALRAALERTLAAPTQAVTWHPMRSAWWIVPFALALGVEWWWRRRRGLP